MPSAKNRYSRTSQAEISQRGKPHRITVESVIPDARARGYFHTLKALFPAIALTSVHTAACYTIDAKLSAKEVTRAAQRLANPLTERSSIGTVPLARNFSYAIEIGFLPGVTDNVGSTARETIEDCIGRKCKEGEGVYSSSFIFLGGRLSRIEAERIAGELSNPLIERIRVFPRKEARHIPIIVPKVRLEASQETLRVDILNATDKELEEIGKKGIKNRGGTRNGPLALSLAAMKTIRNHFKKLGRNPTDVELESLAQTWSEHCKHTIFADPLDEVKEGIYRRYIKGATEKIRERRTANRKQKGADFCVSVFKDNSGAIAFDERYLVTHKVETHNAPSALDPFGGSVTAIVGVNRDCLGFGLGAKPIANTYAFFVAEPGNSGPELYRDQELEYPLLPPRRILEGVVAGVNAGGNQSGIPTPLGLVVVDPSYRGKPLVFGGTVGLIPRRRGGRKLYEKRARAGDHIVMIGGRVGLDGIHGATFSSESLSKGSPATAVQIGDPITQKKLSDALIREVRDTGLYDSITDNGAGGLSGSVGEMAKESGGCRVDLDLVPLKYPGLSPWQIWISESQERMTLAVPKRKWTKLKKVFDRHDVEATRIGVFTKSGRCVVRYRGKNVMDVSLKFLHDGRPINLQKGSAPSRVQGGVMPASSDVRKALIELLRRPSIGSTAFISDQYDHEVQGTSVTKPLHGRGRVNADSAVLRPIPDSPRGIVLAHGYAPWYSAIDTYAMSAAAIDTAVRNAIAAGADLSYLAILDNFCWSSSDKPERLYELKRAAKACFDTATAYGTPFISGKDSMFNDFRGYDGRGEHVHISALPTLLISAIGVIDDVSTSMTIDFKHDGDAIYILGNTDAELGASEYALMEGEEGGAVPRVNLDANKAVYTAVARAVREGCISSAIGIGRGGLAAALAKSAVAGELGAEVRLSSLPGAARAPHERLFAESQGRFLISARAGKESAFEKILRSVPFAKIGKVSGRELAIDDMRVPLSELSDAYRSYFKNW